VSSPNEYISEQVAPTGVRPVAGSMAEKGRSVESFLPRTLTTYEMGVSFVNRLFTASASSRTEFVRADHIRRKSCSALFGAGAQPERLIAVKAIRKVRIVWMANDQLTDGGPPPAPELPDGSAGPPFGAASGSVFLSCLCQSANHSVGSRTAAKSSSRS
jgi:hypothetical protein